MMPFLFEVMLIDKNKHDFIKEEKYDANWKIAIVRVYL